MEVCIPWRPYVFLNVVDSINSNAYHPISITNIPTTSARSKTFLFKNESLFKQRAITDNTTDCKNKTTRFSQQNCFKMLLLSGCILLVFQMRLLQAVSRSQIDDTAHEYCTSYLSQNRSSSFNSSASELRNLCPPWYTISEDYKSCRKGSNVLIDVVTFTNQTWLKKYYCMTTDANATKRIDAVGGCLSSDLHQSYRTFTFPLPCNISELNGYMCAGVNREGQLCGRCEKGFAPPVYSYSLVCTNCTTDYHLNWFSCLWSTHYLLPHHMCLSHQCHLTLPSWLCLLLSNFHFINVYAIYS